MAKLDIELLVIFDEIYKTASITRASENLGIAQPTVSIALNKLRSHFGDILFSRTPKGMEPTPFADHVIGHVRNAAAALQDVMSCRVVFDPMKETREFRICMTEISEMVLLPQLLAYLAEHAPGIRIDSNRHTSKSAEYMQDGAIDLAIGHLPFLEAGFYQQKLYDQVFICLASKNHPRIRDMLTLDDYLTEGHIVVKNTISGRGIADGTLARFGVQRKVKIRALGYLGLVAMVANTDLLATVPGGFRVVAAKEDDIRIFPLPVPVAPYPIKQHWHERYHADPANQWLRQVVSSFGTSAAMPALTSAAGASC
jgi:DNA-binding transcriptional LysR family regulator